MNKKDIIIGLLISLVLAIFISPFASSWLDGLERVAEDKGFIQKGEVEPAFKSPIPDYTWPGVANEKLATSLAGLFGTLIVFAAGYAIAMLIKRR